MRVRALDVDHDWTFGKGRNNYLRDQKAIEQNIQTRLMSFLGDCFFDIGAGIDWFNLLGSKNVIGLRTSIQTIIINTFGVTQLVQLSFNLDSNRNLNIIYAVTTIFTGTNGEINVPVVNNLILTEDGSILTTELGVPLATET